VSFMVIAPEHPLIKTIVTKDQRAEVDKYVDQASRKLELDRKTGTNKTGVFTGAYAMNPVTNQPIPIWTADYVLMDYGTGAIMAVPGHDARDFEFATTYELPIVRVLSGAADVEEPLPFEGEGKLVNSDFLNGLTKTAAIEKMLRHLEEKHLGSRRIEFKLRDWLFSRQRYWGEPFPIVNFSDKGLRAVPLNELPVLLPKVAEYEPSEKGEPPLARSPEFVKYTDASTGEIGRRETDTMPGSAGSSWYFLRYTDPHNDREPFTFEKQKYWMPVDLYVGGPEHSVGHLLYARFWQKVLFDAGLVSNDEPFQKLAHQGIILASDGQRMSKSRGNVVNPDEMKDKYGADSLRLFILFLGPFDGDKPWQEKGIEGVARFLDRTWRIMTNEEGKLQIDDSEPSEALNRVLHKTIKKVGDDIENLGFNTAIAALMILMNELYKSGQRPRKVLKPFLQLLSPFAPHVTEELWSMMGEKGLIALAPWPSFDSNLTVDSTVTIGVQVNGKVRGTVDLAKDASEADAVTSAQAIDSVGNALGGKPIEKVIYKAGRILNLIVK
jgi:leucyl-tRNA synthetase